MIVPFLIGAGLIGHALAGSLGAGLGLILTGAVYVALVTWVRV